MEATLFDNKKIGNALEGLPLRIYPAEARKLRDAGIAKAVKHAGPQWSEQAYRFLLEFIGDNQTFMAEDVRLASYGIVPDPPSKRAWGGVIVRACKAGYIKRAGYRKVKNEKAHCTPAAVWEVV